MNLIYLSAFFIPFLVLSIIIYGFIKKVNIYDCFIEGAKEGLTMSIKIFPYLLGMILAVNIFLDSGVLNFFLDLLKPLFTFLRVPIDILPMAIMRPISGSATLAIMNNIFVMHGPDSFLGRLASTIQGSTDTTIYVLTLYFGSVGIKKIRYAMWAGLLADFVGIIASIILVSFIFN